uniref:Uncharacterized protein n=1 Tax=Plectus sambesii TaxID=2011161 RepID=A0A914UVY2_9BILA
EMECVKCKEQMAFLQEHFASGHGQQLSSIMYFFPQHPGQEISAPQFLEYLPRKRLGRPPGTGKRQVCQSTQTSGPEQTANNSPTFQPIKVEPISFDWQSMDCNDEIMVLQQPQQPQQPQQQMQQQHQPQQQQQNQPQQQQHQHQPPLQPQPQQQLYYQQPQRQPQHQQQVILTNGRPGANVVSQAAAQTHAPQPQQQGQRSPVAATQGQMFVPHLLSFNQ